ncbi:MAG: AAA family ATPase [Candidatus Pacebacteria bacterium]|nr:AAA family ATPase [Candidatus Paceibacterota bacterium]
MPEDLSIKTVYIENFRSIQKETINLKEGLNILVGPNNSGKSNIIEAIDLVLGDVYLPKFEPVTDDFYSGDESKNICISITVYGKALKKIEANFGEEVTIRYKYDKVNGGIVDIYNGKSWITPVSNRPFGEWWPFNKAVHFLRVKSLRSLVEVAPIRWKSPLRYFRDIIIREASHEGNNKLDEVINVIEQAKGKLNEIGIIKDLVDDLLKVTRDQTALRTISISPSSTKYSDVLNDMKVIIDDGYISEVSRKGMGTQNSIIIALFRVMAKHIREKEGKHLLYGIDEPEIGMHPHSQRHLLKSLEKLAEYSQVIITTHSGNLIDTYNINNIIRVNRTENGTKTFSHKLESDERKILEIHGDNLEESFFARRVLLVEGATEEGFFPEASKKVIEKDCNYSFDLNSVSVINCGGDTVWHFLKLFRGLSIPHILLVDDDKLNETLFEKLKQLNILNDTEVSDLKNKDRTEQCKILRNKNVWVLVPFETSISQKSSETTLQKLVNTINFVKKNWGYDIENLSTFSEIKEQEKLKKSVIQYLTKNKRKRVGHAIAHELNLDEYPDDYIELIKIIAQL